MDRDLRVRTLQSVSLLLVSTVSLLAQAGQPTPGVPASNDTDPGCQSQAQPEAKRLFGIIPNYRTSPCLSAHYAPISSREKFNIARQDAFDRGTVVLAAAFAGEAQLTNSNRSFGQGVGGYGKYLAASYADYAIGDFMTEAIFPSLFHQDPRYFRRGHGGTWSRLGYAAGQIFWTHNDSGSTGFNYSELAGNSTAVLISNAYYADNRDAKDAGFKLANQLGVDAASNILKEFWPDIEHKLHRSRP